ncbi:MAG TPA: flagellar hook-length control protein FliK [Woeseiaceae bacterium]|nr:flagellar hook-length control protein FliK [Woeseiaceae bacterium]
MLPEINLQPGPRAPQKNSDNPVAGGAAQGLQGFDFAQILGGRMKTSIDGALELDGGNMPRAGNSLPPLPDSKTIGELMPATVSVGAEGMPALAEPLVELAFPNESESAESQLLDNDVATTAPETTLAPIEIPGLTQPAAQVPITGAAIPHVGVPPTASNTEAVLESEDLDMLAPPLRASSQRAETGERLRSESRTPVSVPLLPVADAPVEAEVGAVEEALAGVRPQTVTTQSAQPTLAPGTITMHAERSAQLLPANMANNAPVTPQGNSIGVPVHAPGWNSAVSQQVLLMTNNKLQNAELRLSPAELGPVRIELKIDDNTATINFHAHHSLTRDALEQAIPRLREMLADNGLLLGNCNVSDSGVEDRAQEREARESAHSSGHHMQSGDSDPDATPAARVRATNGLVDTFV